jgi:hypothetical protein
LRRLDAFVDGVLECLESTRRSRTRNEAERDGVERFVFSKRRVDNGLVERDRPNRSVRQLVRRTGLLLVLGGLLVTAVAPFVPWQSDFPLFRTAGYSVVDGSGEAATAIVLILGPLASGWLLAARWGQLLAGQRSWSQIRSITLRAAFGAILCALAFGWTGDATAAARGPGGPALIAGSAALVLGWLGLALRGPSPNYSIGSRDGWASAVAVAALLAAAGAVVVARTGTLTRVDHTVAPSAMGIDAQAGRTPGSYGRMMLSAAGPLWQLRVSHPLQSPGVLAAARSLIVTRADGIAVLDLQSGTPRWHYLRRDALLTAAAATPDGRFVAILMRRYGSYPTDRQYGLIAGFDLASGRQLWMHAFAAAIPTASLIGARDTVATFTGCDSVQSGAAVPGLGCAAVFGYDASSGVLRWKWQPLGCELAGAAAVDAAIATEVATGEQQCTSSVAVIGARSGRVKIWRLPAGSSAAVPFDLPLSAADGGFAVPVQRRRRGTAGDMWSVATIGVDGLAIRPPVEIGCAPPVAINATPRALACVTVRHGRVWSLRAEGRSRDHVLWRRRMAFASQPFVSALGDSFYVSTGRGYDYRTVEIRATDGAQAGRAAGYVAAAAGGLAVLLEPDPTGATITVFE